jgi:hypothetical protein
MSGECETYIAFVDDPTQELEGYQYSTSARSEQEALLNAQEAFPYGMVKSVHRTDDLALLDEMQQKALRKRSTEQPLDDFTRKIFRNLAKWPDG